MLRPATNWGQLIFEGALLLSTTLHCRGLMTMYRKATGSRLSRLVAHLRIFRLFRKGKFDAYVLLTLAEIVQIE